MNDTARAYSEYLQSKEWDYFTTITFKKQRRDSIYTCGLLWKWLSSDGDNPWGYNIDRAFLISEPHTTGFLHYHGLMHERRTAWDSGTYNASDYQRFLNQRFGRSDVTPIRHVNEVANYCCKYVVKAIDSPGVDYQFLGNWH